jgi:mRNA interferase MazF
VKQYELWWAALPPPVGRRPVLLLSRDSAYEYLHKFIAIEVTTRVRSIPVEVPLGAPEGFKSPCVANCDNVRTVSKSALVKRIGRLAVQRHEEVKRALGWALGWTEFNVLD